MFSSEQFVSSVYMLKRDRRVNKTKKAIYQAFLQLLNDKGYDATTVQEMLGAPLFTVITRVRNSF